MNIRRAIISAILLLPLTAAGSTTTGRNPAAVQEVLQGKRADANAAWWGFNPTDSTATLQAAFDSKATRVLIPYMGKPWIVRPLLLRSNQEVDLAPGVVILAKRGEFQNPGDSLFTARDVSNLTIRGYGATLRMWKHDYQNPPYKKSESRMGVAILGSKNVLIEGLRVESSGGDGFFIDGDSRRLWSEDITIRDCVSDNNHRQGVSIISAINLTIENCTFSNTSGTAPEAGIDLEPDTADQRLENIVIRNSTFENNQGAAMLVVPGNLNEHSSPISILFDHCLARMTKTTGGLSGIFIDTTPPRGMAESHVALRGTLEFRDSTVDSSGKWGLNIDEPPTGDLHVHFERCNWNHAWSTPHPDHKGPYTSMLMQPQKGKGTGGLGGVDFVDSYIYNAKSKPALQVVRGHVYWNVRDLDGRITVEDPAGTQTDLGLHTR